MKAKKFSKKLSVKKATISDLNGREMNEAVGGHTGYFTKCFDYTCGYTCDATCSCQQPCPY